MTTIGDDGQSAMPAGHDGHFQPDGVLANTSCVALGFEDIFEEVGVAHVLLITLVLEAGDIVIQPAGTGHQPEAPTWARSAGSVIGTPVTITAL